MIISESRALPFISGFIDTPIVLNDDVDLFIKESTLQTTFLSDKNMGLFTSRPICKGSILLKVSDQCMMNDGLINLSNVINASSDEETYIAWHEIYKSYYNLDIINKNINVRMVTNDRINFYYEAIKDISPGDELLRIYGFATWPYQMSKHLTKNNITGFIRFLRDIIYNDDYRRDMLIPLYNDLILI